MTMGSVRKAGVRIKTLEKPKLEKPSMRCEQKLCNVFLVMMASQRSRTSSGRIWYFVQKTKEEEDENVNKKFNCSINYCFSIKNVNTLNVFHF